MGSPLNLPVRRERDSGPASPRREWFQGARQQSGLSGLLPFEGDGGPNRPAGVLDPFARPFALDRRGDAAGPVPPVQRPGVQASGNTRWTGIARAAASFRRIAGEPE
jgi:hypothetical protein